MTLYINSSTGLQFNARRVIAIEERDANFMNLVVDDPTLINNRMSISRADYLALAPQVDDLISSEATLDTVDTHNSRIIVIGDDEASPAPL